VGSTMPPVAAAARSATSSASASRGLTAWRVPLPEFSWVSSESDRKREQVRSIARSSRPSMSLACRPAAGRVRSRSPTVPKAVKLVRTMACAGQPAVMAALFSAAGVVTGYALCGVGVEVVCAGVGLGAGAGGFVGGARVGVDAGVAGPGAGVGAAAGADPGAWLLEAAADFVAAALEADGEEVTPGGLDEGRDTVRVEVVAANVCAAVLANITTRPTAATRLRSAARQVSRDTRRRP